MPWAWRFGKGDDQVRFELTFKALNPKLKVIAPGRMEIRSREDALKYAAERHIPVSSTESPSTAVTATSAHQSRSGISKTVD